MNLSSLLIARHAAAVALADALDALTASLAPDLVKTPHPQLNGARFLKEAKFEKVTGSTYPAYKATYRGKTYFMKELPHQAVKEEMAGRAFAKEMGIQKQVQHAQPIEREGKHAIVTKWSSDPTLFEHAAAHGAATATDALEKVPAATRAKMILHEYLVGGARNAGDYFVNPDKGTLTSHDFEFGQEKKYPNTTLGFWGFHDILKEPIPKAALTAITQNADTYLNLAKQHGLGTAEVVSLAARITALQAVGKKDHPTFGDLIKATQGIAVSPSSPKHGQVSGSIIPPKAAKAPKGAQAGKQAEPPDDLAYKKMANGSFDLAPVTHDKLFEDADKMHDLMPSSSSESEIRYQTGEKLAQRLENNADFQAFISDWKQRAGHADVYPNSHAIKEILDDWAGSSSGSNTICALQLAAQKEFGLEHDTWAEYPIFKDYATKFFQENEAGMRAFVRAQYDETQEHLKAAGIEYVAVCRGAHQGVTSAKFAADGKPSKQKLRLQPMNCYTTDPYYAADFAKKGAQGLINGGRVHRSRVFSFCKTGFGTRYESEVVLLGGTDTQLTYGYSNHLASGHHKPNTGEIWKLLADASQT